MEKRGISSDWQQGKSVLQCNQHMLDEELATDVTFEVGSSDETRGVVRAHKYILISRSSVFEAMFCGGMIESRADRDDKIIILDVELNIFREILRYMYSETANVCSETALPLMYAAKKYFLHDLVDRCQRFLQENLSVENACCILELSLTFNEHDLKERCLSFISKYTQEVFELESFLNLSLDALKEIASLNVLMSGEMDLFHACIAWARKQLSASTQNPSDEELRHCLGPVLYCIRFSQMDQVEFTRQFSKSMILSEKEKLQLYIYFNVREDSDMHPFDLTPRKMYEDVVCRYEEVASGSLLLNGKSDAIEFITDSDITLTGVGLYGSPTPGIRHNVTVEIWNGKTLLHVRASSFVSSGWSVPVKISIDEKVNIKSGMNYIIIVVLKGNATFSGCRGKARVLSGGVAFNFSPCQRCSGRTSVDVGQIPQLYFKTLQEVNLITRSKKYDERTTIY